VNIRSRCCAVVSNNLFQKNKPWALEFIIFGREHSDYDVSHQLDVVVFDNIDYAPIFQDRDLVIVRPESVRAVVEVKGFLKPKDVRKCIANYVTLGKLWLEYGDSKLPFPALLLMDGIRIPLQKTSTQRVMEKFLDGLLLRHIVKSCAPIR
jgi:hypothetical protein